MSAPLQGTASAASAIARVKYTHDAMIDLIIANPAISQGQIAEHFGYTQTWVSRVFNSDAFQQRLALRKEDLIDPTLVLSIEERLKALASKSLDVIQEKLELTKSADLALKALELSTRSLGYGARQANVAIQQNFVALMPTKAASATEWAAANGGREVTVSVEPV